MLSFHPYADLFPLIEGSEFAELVADIKANDLRERIVVLDGAILDGRNRYRAALAAGLIDDDDGPDRAKYFVRFVSSVDGDPLAYVISKNLKRRHLNESQRAMVAARLANLGEGRPSETAQISAVSQPDAARTLNVSRGSVQHAKVVQEKGTPELQRSVDQGRLAVSAAAQAAKLDPEKQRKIAQAADAGQANAVRTVIKQEARAVRERELGERQIAAPVGKYGVIVEDFEWDYEVHSRETGMDRHAANHYETAADAHTPEEIVARTRARFECAADDVVLFMYAPIPHLAIAIDVLRLRGFKYVSHYIWRKERIITGWWLRAKHEILLIGVKGKPPCPAPGTQWESVIDAKLGEHSAKPEVFLEMIEQYFPTLPKIELNRRGPPRPGWAAWGNEAEPAPAEIHQSDAAATSVADGVDAPASAVPAMAGAGALWQHADDGLEIPAFLRRGDRECIVGREK